MRANLIIGAYAIIALLAACTGNEKTVTEVAAKEIASGEIWPDDRGEHINAHGGGVMAYEGTYYWYGEHKADTTSSAYVGVTCYSSPNLTDWKYEGVALSVVDEPGHDIERGCVLERPKVIYCPTTKKFVMWFHLELKGQGYAQARYGVAVSDTPTGPFTFLRSGRVNPGLYPLGIPAKSVEKWWTPTWYDAIDRGLFVVRDAKAHSDGRHDLPAGQMARDQTVYVDTDGRAYHIFASEDNLTCQ